ncbi:MAG TPA: hypothetical protein VGF28_24710 [Thermoanaerobaculia bacterium]|jgi:hypothetical protein
MRIRVAVVLAVCAVSVYGQAPPDGTPMIALRDPGVVDLRLDETGVADWRFLNPVKPERLDGQDLQIVNTTGHRTFVVTIPYVFRNDELANAYSAAQILRGGVLMRDVICRALEVSPGNACTDGDRSQLESLEMLRFYREHVKTAKAPDAPAAQLCDIRQPGPSNGKYDLACDAETIYWTATCHFDNQDKRSDVRALLTLGISEDKQRTLDPAINAEAAYYVARLFNDPADINPDGTHKYPPRCGVVDAMCRRQVAMAAFDPAYREDESACERRVAGEFQWAVEALQNPTCGEVARLLERKKEGLSGCRTVGYSAAPDVAPRAAPGTPLSQIVAGKPLENAHQQFVRSRYQIASRELIAAIEDEMRRLNAELQPKGSETTHLLKKIQRARAEVQRSGADEIAVACHQRNLEVSARLFASYDVAAMVPYRDIPEPLFTADESRKCPELRPASAARDGMQDARVANETRRQEVEQERSTGPLEAQVEIVDCKPEGDKTTCTASTTVPPNHRTRFYGAFLRRSPDLRIRVNVSYFDETEPPPNANAYLIWMPGAPATVDKPKGAYTFGFGADATSGYDLPKGFQGHTRHTSETASVSFQYAGPVEVSATLRFKNGDFGGAKATNEINATQYQAKVFGVGGWILQYGRMTFAQPTAGIALSEAGEGLRASYGPASLSYMVRRESDAPDEKADRSDDDADVVLLQVFAPIHKIPIFRGVRQFLVSTAYGEEKKDQPFTKDGTVFVPVPYRYYTVGADLRAPTRRAIFGLGGYRSWRNVRSHELLDDRGTLVNPGDGEGSVFLGTVTFNFTARPNLVDPPSKTNPAYAVTLFLGHGSGNDVSTTNRDEGYLGEKAGFANDLIFLKQVAADDAYAERIGRGLSNKRYTGIQYSDARFSPLAWVAGVFRGKEDIVSRGTVLSAHYYRFNRAVADSRHAGLEIDVEFKVEAPKTVRWFVRGGWLKTSRALETLGLTPRLEKNPWIVNAGVSVALDGR